ncbi:superkiller viralicidic activity 2 2 like [Trichuris trichiura]|uniref:Superkiller viralicidic activity 2 2 like n=1 Tax=Trichuris trichiura TaxID=36087 RepID=A0A077ZEZ1_TRITR|nr:superkiller viralicidic activity 2 2 like [Trichuris trichiura]
MSSELDQEDCFFSMFESSSSAPADMLSSENLATDVNKERKEDRRRRAEELIQELMTYTEQKKSKKSSDVTEEAVADVAEENCEPPSRATVINLQTPDASCKHEVTVPPLTTYEPLRESADPPAMEFPYKLDTFQKEAIRCIENDQSVLVSAHTSAGKTVIAFYAIAYSLKREQRVVYTSPIKALSNQKYRELCEHFPDVGLLTGDVTINPSAACLVMTTEILRSMLYHGAEVMREVGWVIFDEIHYMRDRERGVVWEEAIILLPDSVHHVFLSATIPNGSQFAEWISLLHRQKCHVISTDRRPVPLQHYVYPMGGDGIYLVYNTDGVFNESRFNQAVQTFTSRSNPKLGAPERGRRGGPRQGNSSNLCNVVQLIADTKLTPVIVFNFSRRECEANAMQIFEKINFNTAKEVELINEVFQNAINLLSKEDRKLPQITTLLPVLQRGVGIHHSGLLPILKEVIEILFSEGLIKALFATETFSMGLNMPAKTVLFTCARKFDGTSHRWVSILLNSNLKTCRMSALQITSGEFIQMSGRAGRRGIDERGLVILAIDTMMGGDVAKNIIMGQPDPLNSQFRLTYNMVLNLLRVEGIHPEYMLERSFSQFQNSINLPKAIEKVKALQLKYDDMKVPNEDELTSYCVVKSKIDELKMDMLRVLTKPMYIVPFLSPGRLLHVKSGDDDFGWGVVVNFRRIIPKGQKDDSSPSYVIDVLIRVSPSCLGEKQISRIRPPKPGEAAKLEVVPVLLNCVYGISSIRVFYPKNLNNEDNRLCVLKSLEQVKMSYSDAEGGIPLLDPVNDMHIEDEGFKETAKYVEVLEKQLSSMPVRKTPDFESSMEKFEEKRELESRLNSAKAELENAQKLFHMEELQARKRVLRRLGFCTAQDVITLKGRVACEISAGDELLLTEMLFDGKFADLDPSTCAAVLSCIVFQEKAELVELNEQFTQFLVYMQRTAKRIARVSAEVNLPINEDEYIASIRPHMMPVVHAWCEGKDFATVSSMTTVFEGSIIRTMRRLEELLCEMCLAAKAMGSKELEQKFNDASVAMKRGIVFAASLYL